MLIKIANLTIDVNYRYKYTEAFCKDYVTVDSVPDFGVSVSDAVLSEKLKENPEFSDGYVECLEIYREICRKALSYGAMLMHSAAICMEGKAYLFTAVSGTGKTTHINLWKKRFGDKCRIINGDKPLIRKIDGKFCVCGTPWQGKENYGENAVVPIGGICILERGEKNEIKKIAPAEAIPTMLVQTLRTNDTDEMDKLLKLIDDVLKSVPFYKLKCNMDAEAADISWQGMR